MELIKCVKEILFDKSFGDVLLLAYVLIFLSPGLTIVYLYHSDSINELNIILQYILVTAISLIIYICLVISSSLWYIEIKKKSDNNSHFLNIIPKRKNYKKSLVVLGFQLGVTLLLVFFYSFNVNFEVIWNDIKLIILAIVLISITSIFKLIRIIVIYVYMKVFNIWSRSRLRISFKKISIYMKKK